MREGTARHILATAETLRQGMAGTSCKITWVSSSTGTWDSSRGEWVGGTATTQTVYNASCLIKELTPERIKWGRFGDTAQTGDLIVALEDGLDLEDKKDVKIIIGQREYLLVPNSDIPAETLSGIIGDLQCYKILHCRYNGVQSGVV